MVQENKTEIVKMNGDFLSLKNFWTAIAIVLSWIGLHESEKMPKSVMETEICIDKIRKRELSGYLYFDI